MSSYDLEMAKKLQAQFDMEDGVKCSRIAQSPVSNLQFVKWHSLKVIKPAA